MDIQLCEFFQKETLCCTFCFVGFVMDFVKGFGIYISLTFEFKV